LSIQLWTDMKVSFKELQLMGYVVTRKPQQATAGQHGLGSSMA
jgi:hypothetical protein